MSTRKKVDLRVGNLDCEHDAAVIERGLPGFDGLETLKVYPKSAKMALAYDPTVTDDEGRKTRMYRKPLPQNRGPLQPRMVKKLRPLDRLT